MCNLSQSIYEKGEKTGIKKEKSSESRKDKLKWL